MLRFDFDSVKDRMTKSLQSKTSWAKVLPYSTNGRLIDIVCERISEMARYDEYLTRERKWRLAQNRTSLMYEANILGYAPKRKVAPIGFVRLATNEDIINTVIYRSWEEGRNFFVSDKVAYDGKTYTCLLDNEDVLPDANPTFWQREPYTYPFSIPIDKYATFSNENNDIIVTCISDTVLTPLDDYVDVEVVQGIAKTETFLATGIVFEEFTVVNSNIAETYMEIFVNDVLWTLVGDIRLAEGADQVYQIENMADFSGIYIKFGNDIFGKKLSLNDNIVFKYIDTNGISGNITSSEIITNIVSTLQDSEGSVPDVFCTNEFSIGGGKDEEDIETIRANAPLTFQTGGRATSTEDYISIIEGFEYVSRAIVWGEYEYNIDNNNPPGTYVPIEENVVHIAAFTTTGEGLNTLQKAEIRDYLNQYKAPTDIIKFEEVDTVGLKFMVSAYVEDRSYTLSVVKNNIISGLSTYYNINNRSFGQPIYESDYKSYIDSITGVGYHNSYIVVKNYRVFQSGYISSWVFSVSPVKANSVKIYLQLNSDPYILIGTDDGSGALNAESGYDLSGSLIDYEYGTGLLKVDAISVDQFFEYYTIKIEYETTLADLILTKRSQVFSYEESEIAIAYIPIER